MHNSRLDEALRKEKARINQNQDIEFIQKTKLAKLESVIADSITTIIYKIETKLDKVEENQSFKIEHMKGSKHTFYCLTVESM